MASGSSSGSGGLQADMNVTPLIDALLVLLIIFMVIVAHCAARTGCAGASASDEVEPERCDCGSGSCGSRRSRELQDQPG